MVTNHNNGRSSTIFQRNVDFPLIGQGFTCNVPSEDDPDETLERKLELVGTLGKGGMAVVYDAKWEDEEPCAVKVLEVITGLNSNEAFVQKFLGEMKSLYKISRKKDTNVLPIIASGRETLTTSSGREQEILYIIMPKIEEENLTEKVTGKKLHMNQAQDIMLQMAKALRACHEEGIIHRDFKPGNIFVEDNGRAWLADLGLAKDIDDRTADETAAETVQGTPEFMSPEQALGKKIDKPSSDIYSFGSTYYYLLTGKKPFSAPSVMLVVRMLQEAADPYSEPLNPLKANENVNPKLAEIIERCTKPGPEERFSDANELVHELEAFKETNQYTPKQKEDILNDTIITRWYDWIIPFVGLYKKFLGKKDVEKLLRTNEKAAWITSGKTRRNHQNQVIKYFNQLKVMIDKSEMPEDIYLIVNTVRRQLKSKEIAEVKRKKIRGFGLWGKKEAQKCMDLIEDAEDKWLNYYLGTADDLRKEAKKIFNTLRIKLRQKVSDDLEDLESKLECSQKLQNARDLLIRAKDYLSQGKIDDAEKVYNQADVLLVETDNPEKQNPHRDPVVSEAEKVFKLKQEERNLIIVKDIIGDMERYIDNKDFKKAHITHRNIENKINEIPISDRRRDLRHQVQDAEKALKTAEHYEEAMELYKGVEEDISKFRYDLAQARYDRIGTIIIEYLKGEEHEEFRKGFEKDKEKLRKRMHDLSVLDDVIKKAKGEIYPTFTDDIKSVFESEKIPELDVLRRFNDDVYEQLMRLNEIDRSSVDDRYDTIREGLNELDQNVTKYEEIYIQKRFKGIESIIKGMTGENSREDYYSTQESAIDKLDEVREVVNVVKKGDLKESLRQRCKELGREIREQYNFADSIQKIRAAISNENIKEAEEEFEKVTDERKKDIGLYIRAIDLEKRKTDVYEQEKATLGNYRQIIEAFKTSEKQDDDDAIKTIIGDIEEKGYFKEAADELRNMLEERSNYINEIIVAGKKRESRSKDAQIDELKGRLEETKNKIYEKLDDAVQAIESNFLESKRKIYVKLAKTYSNVKLQALADKYFVMIQKP